MLNRFGFEARDYRNLKITIGLMTVLFFVFADAPIPTRLTTAIAGGLISGVVFILITAAINRFVLYKW